MNINIHIAKEKWLKEIKGDKAQAYLIGHVLQEKKIETFVSKDVSLLEFEELVKDNVDGFYSLIIKADNSLYAAVDHIRSHPLFYTKKGDQLYLSDSADWIKRKLKIYEVDEDAKEEFSLLGYVSGRDTLFSEIKQLKAGETLSYRDGVLEVKRYYVFDRKEINHCNIENYLYRLKVLSEHIVDKLIKYASGRQIVIPLSGGYDSRLIAVLLKAKKYDNIITYTYGTRNSKEVRNSRIVANNLKIKWVFIEYTPELWSQVWNRKDRTDFQRYASNHSSLPHTQDWPAVIKMKEMNHLEDGAVFVPGHCCVTSFFSPDMLGNLDWREIDTKRSLIEKHYRLKDNVDFELKNNKKIRSYLNEYVKDVTGDMDYHSSKIMQFNWEERQAKYISNSCRLYEFLGYDWWQPLWDKEFCEFWRTVPLELMVERKLYIQWVSGLYEMETNNTNLKNSSDEYQLITKLRVKVKKALGNSPLIKLLVFRLYRKFLVKDYILNAAKYNKDCYLSLRAKGYSEIGVESFFFLNEFYNK